eukprot:gene1701-470_t
MKLFFTVFKLLLLLAVVELNSQLTLPTSGYLATFKVGSTQTITSYASNPDQGPKRYEVHFLTTIADRMSVYLEPTSGVIANITGIKSQRSIGGISNTVFQLETLDTRNYRLYVKPDAIVQSVDVTIGASGKNISNSTYDQEKALYTMTNAIIFNDVIYDGTTIPIYYVFIPFYAYNLFSLVMYILLCLFSVLLTLVLKKCKNTASMGNRNDLKKKKKKEGILLGVGITIALFGLILMCIPPAAGVLPYSFTCCDYFKRSGESKRCIGGLGVYGTYAHHQCFWNEKSDFFFMGWTWYFILPFWIFFWIVHLIGLAISIYSSVRFTRLLKKQKKFKASMSFVVSSEK